MANKMTKKDYFNQLLAIKEVSANEGLVGFINHEIELLAKKSGKSGQTKTQKENEVILKTIVECLATDRTPMTITELQGAYTELADFSNQKLSALMKKLVDNGTVTKTIDKKKSYFVLANKVEETEVEGEQPQPFLKKIKKGVDKHS